MEFKRRPVFSDNAESPKDSDVLINSSHYDTPSTRNFAEQKTDPNFIDSFTDDNDLYTPYGKVKSDDNFGILFSDSRRSYDSNAARPAENPNVNNNVNNSVPTYNIPDPAYNNAGAPYDIHAMPHPPQDAERVFMKADDKKSAITYAKSRDDYSAPLLVNERPLVFALKNSPGMYIYEYTDRLEYYKALDDCVEFIYAVPKVN